LPADIVWRTKLQFDEGSGTLGLLDEALAPSLASIDLASDRAMTREPLRSVEEAFYHRLLSASYPRPELILSNVARWTDDRRA
jgi:hypothetical protein